MITGTNNQTYRFSNNATADNGQTTSTVQTSLGSIGLTYATVSPNYVGKGSTNKTLNFVAFNSTGLGTKSIRFRAANTSFVASSASSPDPAYSGWTNTISGKDVTFTSPGTSSNLPSGANANFQITYSSFPAPASDTNYQYSVLFTESDNSTSTYSSLDFYVTVYQISLSRSPSTNIPSNSNGTSDITATVTNNGVAANNVTVAFSTTDGKLSAASVATNVSGQATTTLTAPSTPTDIEATVTATINSAAQTTTVYIDGTNAENSSSSREKY